MFDFLDPTKVAESQLSSYDPKTGKREKDFGDHLGDGLMSIFMPGFGSKVDQATQDLHVDTLKQGAGNRLTRYGSVSGGEDTSDLTRLSSRQLDQRLNANQTLKDTRTKASVTTGRDRSEYMELNDPDAIMSLAAGHVKQDKEKKEKEARDRETSLLERSERREDNRIAASERRQDALYAHQVEQTNLQNAHNAAETNKTRLHELALQEARNNQTMQLAMMDREDKLADRRYAREDRAADRRQQSIMMLIKGLAQLGQGFSL